MGYATIKKWVADLITRVKGLDDIHDDLVTVDGNVDIIKESTFTVTGAVVDDVLNSATTFETNLTQANNDFYNDLQLKMTSGACSGQARRISDYDGATKFVTLAVALLQEPVAGDTFQIIPLIAGAAAGGGDATLANQEAILTLMAGETIEDTYPHPSGVAEGVIFTLTLTKRTVIHGVKIYTKNLTKSTSFRCFLKDNAGVYTQTEEDLVWTIADKDVVMFIGLVHDRDVQFRMQSSVAEGAPRDVLYSVIAEEMNI